MCDMIESSRLKRTLNESCTSRKFVKDDSIWSAIRIQDKELDPTLLRRSNWTQYNDEGFSLTTWSAKHGFILALDYAYDLTLKDGRGKDAVYTMIECMAFPMFEQVLVRKLVDIDRVIHGAPTRPYLIDAIEHGMGPCIRMLLERGANVNAADISTGKTPLMAAAAKGHTVFVRKLVKLGALVDARDHVGKTALWHAVMEKQLYTAHKLIYLGANPTTIDTLGGYTLLHWACSHTKLELVGFLLTHGIDPTRKDKANRQADECFTSDQHPDVTATKQLIQCAKSCYTYQPFNK